jgi:hypothetical protein
MRDLSTVVALSISIFKQDFGGKKSGKYNVTTTGFLEHILRSARLRDTDLQSLNHHLSEQGYLIFDMGGLLHVTTVTALGNFRKAPGRIISDIVEASDKSPDPVAVLADVYGLPFGGRKAGWYRIAPADLFVASNRVLTPETLNELQDRLRWEQNLWLFDAGHTYVVIGDKTLNRTRKVSDRWLEKFVSESG